MIQLRRHRGAQKVSKNELGHIDVVLWMLDHLDPVSVIAQSMDVCIG